MAGRPRKIKKEEVNNFTSAHESKNADFIYSQGEIRKMKEVRNVILAISARPGADGDTVYQANEIVNNLLAEGYTIFGENAFSDAAGTILVHFLLVR